LNRRRAIGAARAAVRDDGGCLSRAARKRFTADGLLAGTNERPLCLPMRISPDPCLCKHVAYWHKADMPVVSLDVRFRGQSGHAPCCAAGGNPDIGGDRLSRGPECDGRVPLAGRPIRAPADEAWPHVDRRSCCKPARADGIARRQSRRARERCASFSSQCASGSDKLNARCAMHFVWRLAILLMVGLAPSASFAREPLPRSVLYLDENDPGLPFAQGISAAFRAALNAGSAERIAVYSENLDLVRSSGPRYEEILKTYLREKYRDRPIGVIATVG